jgi:hypothetical protein
MSSTTFMYVETDIPEGMSLDAWPSRLVRLWRAVAG